MRHHYQPICFRIGNDPPISDRRENRFGFRCELRLVLNPVRQISISVRDCFVGGFLKERVRGLVHYPIIELVAQGQEFCPDLVDAEDSFRFILPRQSEPEAGA